MSEYGMTLNCSYVQDSEGEVTVGAHYTNTDGQDIEITKSGTSLEDVILDMYDDFVTQMLTPPVEEEETEKEELDTAFLLAENAQLRQEIAWLREHYLGAQETIEELNKDFDEICNENDALYDELKESTHKKNKKDIDWVEWLAERYPELDIFWGKLL